MNHVKITEKYLLKQNDIITILMKSFRFTYPANSAHSEVTVKTSTLPCPIVEVSIFMDMYFYQLVFSVYSKYHFVMKLYWKFNLGDPYTYYTFGLYWTFDFEEEGNIGYFYGYLDILSTLEFFLLICSLHFYVSFIIKKFLFHAYSYTWFKIWK